MEKKLLLELIDTGRAGDMVHFERGILRMMLSRLRVLPYFHDGYIARLHTTAMYFRNSMALLDPAVRRDLFSRDNPIRTRVRDNAPTYYAESARVRNSLIADGCRIEGTVENSILFRGVTVAPGAVVRNSVVMQSSAIGKGACLRRQKGPHRRRQRSARQRDLSVRHRQGDVGITTPHHRKERWVSG